MIVTSLPTFVQPPVGHHYRIAGAGGRRDGEGIAKVSRGWRWCGHRDGL
ncbi:MAG: hypothetical protein R3E61_04565 [Pseudomonadales bacterium]